MEVVKEEGEGVEETSAGCVLEQEGVGVVVCTLCREVLQAGGGQHVCRASSQETEQQAPQMSKICSQANGVYIQEELRSRYDGGTWADVKMICQLDGFTVSRGLLVITGLETWLL